MLCVNIVALFNKKARLLMQGHRNAWRILRQQIGNDTYIWFHAASLGEFEQGRPIMERLKREHPEKKILLTFFSPSGYEVRKNYNGADVICYLPFDTPLNARKFIKLAKPEMAFFIKYEFWRNYIEVLHHQDIPCYSVSSIFRRNQIFFRPYGRGYARVLQRLTHIFVQNESSLRLLKDTFQLTNVSVVGDTRFDRVIDIMNQAKPLPLVEAFVSKASQVLVAGSTWPPDEDILIEYFNTHPNLKLVLAPHVVSEEHLQEIEKKLKRSFVRYTKATHETAIQSDCLMIDCYGKLSSIYRYGSVAYVGGGFGVGIHNVPEAAVYGLPVLIGPNNAKFREAQSLKANGGCFEVNSLEHCHQVLDKLFTHPEVLKKAGDAAGLYIRQNAGAANKVYDVTLR